MLTVFTCAGRSCGGRRVVSRRRRRRRANFWQTSWESFAGTGTARRAGRPRTAGPWAPRAATCERRSSSCKPRGCTTERTRRRRWRRGGSPRPAWRSATTRRRSCGGPRYGSLLGDLVEQPERRREEEGAEGHAPAAKGVQQIHTKMSETHKGNGMRFLIRLPDAAHSADPRRNFQNMFNKRADRTSDYMVIIFWIFHIIASSLHASPLFCVAERPLRPCPTYANKCSGTRFLIRLSDASRSADTILHAIRNTFECQTHANTGFVWYTHNLSCQIHTSSCFVWHTQYLFASCSICVAGATLWHGL